MERFACHDSRTLPDVGAVLQWRRRAHGEVVDRDAHRELAQGGLEDPPKVLPVERLVNNVEVMHNLTAPATLPRVRLCASDVLLALHIPGTPVDWVLGPQSQGPKESCTS